MKKYKTNSLSLASALSLFLPITSIEKDIANNNCLFCFDDTPQLRELISNYWNKNLQVDASEYFAQTKTLKARIHEIL
jgi:hypothetical protein